MSNARRRGNAAGAEPKPAARPAAVLVGTSLLPEDEEAKPDKRTGPVWKQVATDTEGRRRFHGAFTGGFSAGYFNTVGTKEGWAPSTFVSSRSQRAAVQQRPQDFMDDEDYTEAMVGGRAVGMREEFKSFGPEAGGAAPTKPGGQQGPPPPALGGGSIAAFLPHDLLVAPTTSPIGVKLLRLMGWREGQGVGPRMQRKRQTRRKSTPNEEALHSQQQQQQQKKPPMPPPQPKKVYGLAISLDELRADRTPDDEEEEEVNDDSEEKDGLGDGFLSNTLPPVDTKTVVFEVKSNLYGLGYDPYHSAPELRGRDREGGKVQQRRTIGALLSGDAHGHGGFGVGAFEKADDPSHLFPEDRLEDYDRELRDDHEEMGSRQFLAKPVIEDEDDEMDVDGLLGFRRSAQRLAPTKWYPPPEVPSDYRPFHYFQTSLYTDDAPAPAMNAERRGEVLGETPLPTPHMARTEHKGSVFELVSSADKQRLTALKSRFEKSESETEAMGQAATYHRFANEPAKQMRFRNFLLVHSGQPAPPLPAHYDNLTEWEREKEKEDFLKIANDFKKVPDAMASRFQSAGQLDPSGTTEGETGPESVMMQEDHQAIAASMKMFGKMTRKEEDWFPENLLCKRFNLRQPHPDRKRTQPQGVAPLLSGIEMLLSPTQLAMTAQATPTPSQEETVALQPLADHIQEEKQDEETEEEQPGLLPPEAERPAVDIFKAIFEPEESEEEEEEEEEEHKGGDGGAPENFTPEPPPTEKRKEPEQTAQPTPTLQPLPAPPALPELAGGHFAPDNPYLYVPPKRETRGQLPLQAEVPLPLKRPESPQGDKDNRERKRPSERDDRKREKKKRKKDKERRSRKERHHRDRKSSRH